MFTLKKNQQTIDVDYWHKVVALSILYDEIEKCYEKRCESKGFKSRTAAYTMSAISYLTNQELDLVYIWKTRKFSLNWKKLLKDLLLKSIVILIWTIQGHSLKMPSAGKT